MADSNTIMNIIMNILFKICNVRKIVHPMLPRVRLHETNVQIYYSVLIAVLQLRITCRKIS